MATRSFELSQLAQAYDQTPAEIAAGVTPVDYAYEPGYSPRYGVMSDGVTDDTAALLNWLKLGGSHTLKLKPGISFFSSPLPLPNSGTDIYAYGATLKAKDSTDFEKTVYLNGLFNCSIRGLKIDVNQANRSATLTQRSVGLWMDNCTDCYAEDCVVQNAIGYTGISGFAFAIGNLSVRCKLINPTAESCGIAGKAADAIFVSGTQCTVVNPTCVDCLDTGIAIESSQQSGCIGGTILRCGCVCAITNAVAGSANDNYIDGLTGYDWDAGVTGGIQIGNPLNTSTGNLLNTRLSNITLRRNAGSGPAINVRQTGTAITQGLTLSNLRVKGAGSQLLLLEAQDVKIEGGDWEGVSVNPIMQFLPGSARIQVNNPTMRGQFNFGIYSDGVSDVNVIDPVITGNGADATYGVYFANTASNCRVRHPIITGTTTGTVGSDAGTDPDVVYAGHITTLAYSASMTPNAALGPEQVITATNGTAFAINAPLHPISGRRLTLTIVNSSGGAMGAITWNAIFKMSAWTNPANGFSRSIMFRYNGTSWVQIGQTGVDIPN